MVLLIFLVLAVILTFITIYFSLREKIVCPNCKSRKVVPTGNKKYKEDPLGLMGSPVSYHELEYTCSKCSGTFWVPQKAAIFN